MKKLTLLVVLGLLLPAALASAKNHPHPPAGINITIPDDWKIDGDNTVLMTAPSDQSAFVAFIVLDVGDLKAALQILDQQLGKFVKNVRMGKGAETQLNTMPAYVAEGKGVANGSKVDIGAALIVTPKQKVVLVLALGQIGKYEAHKPAIEGIITSLRPLRAERKNPPRRR